MIGQGIGGIGVLVRRHRSWGWEILGQEMVECGAFVRRKRSGGWEGTEHLYEGNEARYGRERSGCLVRSEKTL